MGYLGGRPKISFLMRLKMKLSWYTIVLDDYPTLGQSLLFNTRTQAMVKINESLGILLRDLTSDEISEEEARQIKQLEEMGIVVKDEDTDRKGIEEFFSQLKYGHDPEIFAVTILTTYNCNFDCVYCFENFSRSQARMDFQLARQTANWVKRRVEYLNVKRLHVTFYGGEPLLNKEALEYVASDLSLWCEQENVRFSFMLQTNGYLVTEDLIQKYKRLGLTKVQISLDGIGEAHDQKRPLKGGGGTFKKVLSNIIEIVDLVDVIIATGYERDLFHIRCMLQFFSEIGLLHKFKRFIFAPIHATLGPHEEPAQIRNCECLSYYSDENLVKTTQELRGLMREFHLPLPYGFAVTMCPVTRENGGVLIDPQGDIYKCASMLGYKNFSVGTVFNDQYNEQHKTFVNMDVWHACPRDCVYLPVCAGGCRLSAFLNYQDMTRPKCYKSFLDQMAGDFLKTEYERHKTGTELK